MRKRARRRVTLPRGTLTEAEMRERLSDHIEAAGSGRRLAEAWEISHSYLAEAARGRQGIGPRIAAHMGYRRVEYYIPLSEVGQ